MEITWRNKNKFKLRSFFCFLILLAICMPIFLIYNNAISQSGSKMEQCNSLLPRHPCPFCGHLPWFMVFENCHPFNQYLRCHTIDMQKDEKVNNPRCDKGGRKGILILCMVGRSTFIEICAQTMCTPNCHVVYYYWH